MHDLRKALHDTLVLGDNHFLINRNFTLKYFISTLEQGQEGLGSSDYVKSWGCKIIFNLNC